MFQNIFAWLVFVTYRLQSIYNVTCMVFHKNELFFIAINKRFFKIGTLIKFPENFVKTWKSLKKEKIYINFFLQNLFTKMLCDR